MIALALLTTWSLTFTPPVIAATPDSVPCLDLSACVAMELAPQSPTWRDSSAVMLASDAGWSRLWPRVRQECEPVQRASVGVTWQANPPRTSIALPDSLHGQWIVVGRAINRDGAWSNIVVRP